MTYAIIDEVDHILIDECRTPFYIASSGSGDVSPYAERYRTANQVLDATVVNEIHSRFSTEDVWCSVLVLGRQNLLNQKLANGSRPSVANLRKLFCILNPKAHDLVLILVWYSSSSWILESTTRSG